jgi:predicted TIM-barrel fold metal-dependent hydrolase
VKKLIVDAHVHIGTMDGRSRHFGSAPREFSAEDMIALMNRNGVDKVVVNPFGRMLNDRDFEEKNQVIVRAAKKYPNRIIPFTKVNPWLDDCVQLFDRAVNEWGCKGLKLHPISDAFQANDDLVYPLIEMAAKFKIPVQIHSHQPGSQPALIGDLAERFPDVTFIMAHMGMNLYKDAIFVARILKNVVLETSAQPWTHRICRLVADEVGSDRLVWGSDAPLHHQEIEMMKVKMSALNEEEKRKVLGENIARILNLS